MPQSLSLSPARSGSPFAIAGFKQVYSTQAVETALEELDPPGRTTRCGPPTRR